MEYVLVFTFTGALHVMELLKEAGLKPDCILYTTLISTCAKCGKVDAMFEVGNEITKLHIGCFLLKFINIQAVFTL